MSRAGVEVLEDLKREKSLDAGEKRGECEGIGEKGGSVMGGRLQNG